jgi:exopolysaccharide biosynthesis protein
MKGSGLQQPDYGVWNALNLDGGGSTTMAVEAPVAHDGDVQTLRPVEVAFLSSSTSRCNR